MRKNRTAAVIISLALVAECLGAWMSGMAVHCHYQPTETSCRIISEVHVL